MKNKIPASEEMTMLIIWGESEAPRLTTIIEKVNKRFGKDWKMQTVSTFVHRLIKKGFVKSERQGRYTYYSPLISLEEYQKESLEYVLNVIYAGDKEKFKKDTKKIVEEATEE